MAKSVVETPTESLVVAPIKPNGETPTKSNGQNPPNFGGHPPVRQFSLLGRFLIGGLIVFEILILFLIGYIWLNTEAEPHILNEVSLTLILGWVGLLMFYYAWIIYFYNFNFGRSDRFWDKFIEKADECNKNGLKHESELYEEMGAPRSNPYIGETFGLPPGTVRGTLTLTILIGGLALTIIFIGQDHAKQLTENTVLHNYFLFFEDAFLMVVAFYFGTKGLDIIQKERTSRTIENKRSENEEPSEEEVGLEPSTQGTTKATPKSPSVFSTLASIPAEAPTAIKTKAQIIEANYPHVKDLEAERVLSIEDKNKFATQYGLELATIEAVIRVESRGSGFLKDGRPIILFEGHVFWKELIKRGIDPKTHAPNHAYILYPRWTREFYQPGTGEYLRLEEAQKIDREAALCSASWGLFQVMGYHYEKLGYGSVEEFVDRQFKSEYEHLETFGRYIKKFKLIDALKKKDWASFAKGYNGPAYAKNQYDIKLEKYYMLYSNDKKVIA